MISRIKLPNLVFTRSLPIETRLDTGISPRQLRRLFETTVGDSAKVFSRVVRFQHALADVSTTSGKFAHDVGYYDQAHFIKEFKQFYGVTPAAFLVE